MTLRIKTLLIVSAAITGLLAILLFSAVTILTRGFDDLESSIRALAIILGVAGLVFTLVVWFLLERIILTPVAKMTTAISAIGSTGAFNERLPVAGKDELASLAGTINHLWLESLEQRSNDLDRRLLQIRNAAEIAQLTTQGGARLAAGAAPSLAELLKNVIYLIVERFNYANVSIYLLDEAREYAVLADTTSEGNNRFKVNTFKVAVGSRSMVGWVTANNRLRVAADVSQDPYYIKDEFLPDIRSEAVLPISIGEVVLGTLDIQSSKPNSFPPSDLNIIQTLSNQLATAVHNLRLLESTQINLEESSLLYQASRNITQADSTEEILRVVDLTLHQTSYITAVYSVSTAGLRKVLQATPAGSGVEVFSERLPWAVDELDSLLTGPYFIIQPPGRTGSAHSDSPPEQTRPALLHLLQQWQCEAAAVLPVICSKHLAALFVLGARQRNTLNSTSLQPYVSLAEVTASALQKVQALQTAEKSLTELRTLNAVSQAISVQTDLVDLYQVIHNAANQFMGNVNFLLALYDPETMLVQIPYMWEKDKFLTVAPFTLGEGLTSIVIRNRQPLMLIEDAVKKAKELGAFVIGEPARSWLGVPMMVGGDVIGAIVVQDMEQEHRFSEEDQRLLSTLAAQVAAAIRNAQTLEKTRLQARRERRLHEITSKIRSSVDMNTILTTATTELGKAFNARRTRITLGVPMPEAGRAPQGETDGEDDGV